jgi:hypothetical protein
MKREEEDEVARI